MWIIIYDAKHQPNVESDDLLDLMEFFLPIIRNRYVKRLRHDTKEIGTVVEKASEHGLTDGRTPAAAQWDTVVIIRLLSASGMTVIPCFSFSPGNGENLNERSREQ
jgi:hypothetical protein